MKKISTLKNLLSEKLRELYHAETQQIYFLPTVMGKVENNDLKIIIQQQIKNTGQQKKRLKNILGKLFVPTIGSYSDIMTGFIDEAYGLMDRSASLKIRDTVIITSIQYMKHFEIAGYGCVHAYAEELGFREIADQLYDSLEEEKEIDMLLSEIAVNLVNSRAKSLNIF